MNRVKRQFGVLMSHNMAIFIELLPSYAKLCLPMIQVHQDWT